MWPYYISFILMQHFVLKSCNKEIFSVFEGNRNRNIAKRNELCLAFKNAIWIIYLKIQITDDAQTLSSLKILGTETMGLCSQFCTKWHSTITWRIEKSSMKVWILNVCRNFQKIKIILLWNIDFYAHSENENTVMDIC